MPYRVASLLDRLLDEEPLDARSCVFRDLLWLLNTRRRKTDEKELTVLDFGLSEIEDEELESELKRTIEAFEPRLKNVLINTVDLMTVSPQHSLRDGPGDRSNASVNPFFGLGHTTDATGRDIASKRFRTGIVIEAELHGFEEGGYVTFEMTCDEDGCFHGQ